MPGKGNVQRTGSLGDVMKESVEAARTVVRARARRLGVRDEIFEKTDLHVHFPEGATPKDGPSAGIAITTSIVSALSGIPVRADVAMTGEITLRGEVLAIGGLKEKLLAAHRGGIKSVLIPEENVKDLAEIPDNVKNRLGCSRQVDRQGARGRARASASAADRRGSSGHPAQAGRGRSRGRGRQALMPSSVRLAEALASSKKSIACA
jgi:ATP-dependent Lon protease